MSWIGEKLKQDMESVSCSATEIEGSLGKLTALPLELRVVLDRAARHMNSVSALFCSKHVPDPKTNCDRAI